MRTHTGVMLLVASLGAVVLSGTSCPMNPPTPSGFTNANLVRGGKLYDKWWKVAGVTEPTTDHPLWASRPDTTSNTRTGSATSRCKECHGWDYKGVNGVYATGSHRTGIIGIFGTTKTAQEVFDLLKNDAPATTNGHSYGAAGLIDADIWDLAKFVLGESSGDMGAQYDTSAIINSSGVFNTGNATTGQGLFDTSGIGTGVACATCHGTDGKLIDFGPAGSPEFIGTVANDNPWEFQHKVRFGQPDPTMLPMPSSVDTGGTEQDIADVGAHAQTLPQV